MKESSQTFQNHTYLLPEIIFPKMFSLLNQQTNKLTNKQTNNQQKQTNKQTKKKSTKADKQTNKQTHNHSNKQKQTNLVGTAILAKPLVMVTTLPFAFLMSGRQS